MSPDVDPGADRSEVGIYQIRDGKTVRSQTFHADSAQRLQEKLHFRCAQTDSRGILGHADSTPQRP